jgi:hypothetical protein
MRRALIASIILHVGVLAASFLDWPFAPKRIDDLSPPISVELVTIADLTNIPKVTPKPKEAKVKPKEPEKTKAEKTPPPPPPPPPEVQPEPEKPAPKPEKPKPQPVAKPEPEPAPAEKPKVAEKPQPAKPKPEKAAEKKEEKPKPVKTAEKEPDKKPEPKPKKPRVPPDARSKEDFDPGKIAALLDRSSKQDTPDAKFDVNQIREALDVKPTNAPPTLSQQLTMTELDALRARLAQCWNIPAGAQDAQSLIVKIHIWLNPDGSLARDPEVANSASGGVDRQYFQIAAESAVRAVYACRDAFAMLPKDKYGTWRDMIINFDPKEMLSG